MEEIDNLCGKEPDNEINIGKSKGMCDEATIRIFIDFNNMLQSHNILVKTNNYTLDQDNDHSKRADNVCALFIMSSLLPQVMSIFSIH